MHELRIVSRIRREAGHRHAAWPIDTAAVRSVPESVVCFGEVARPRHAFGTFHFGDRRNAFMAWSDRMSSEDIAERRLTVLNRTAAKGIVRPAGGGVTAPQSRSRWHMGAHRG